MQLPKPPRREDDSMAVLVNIVSFCEKLHDYLEAKENAEHLRQIRMTEVGAGNGHTANFHSETPTCNCGKSNAMCPLHGSIRTSHTANFHSETKEPMFKANDFITMGNNMLVFNTPELLKAAREALLKLKR